MNRVLPGHWRLARLDEAADVTLGQSPPGDSYNESGAGMPFFQGKAEFGSLHPQVRKFTTAGTKFAAAGDILLSVRAPVGPTNVTTVDCAIGRGLAGVRARSDVNEKYLLWALRAQAETLASMGAGSTFPAVTGKQVRSLPIPIAPPDEQRRIVDILEDHLSRIDAANDYLSAAARRSELAVHAELGALWDASARNGRWMRVEDLGRVITGSTPKGGADAFGGVTPFVTPSDVGHGEQIASWQRTLSDSGSATSRLLPAGSVLAVCIGATLGKVGWTSVAAATNQQINGVVIELDHVDAAYVAALMAAPGFQDQMRSQASSTTMPILNKSKFSALSIPVATIGPAQSAWDRFMQATEASLRVRNAVETANRRAATLRSAVLRAAFSGSLTDIPVTAPVPSEFARV